MSIKSVKRLIFDTKGFRISRMVFAKILLCIIVL